MKEKEKNIYGIHQYTLTRRRKIRGKKRKIKRKPNKESFPLTKHTQSLSLYLYLDLYPVPRLFGYQSAPLL
jgi:hypothetical protein